MHLLKDHEREYLYNHSFCTNPRRATRSVSKLLCRRRRQLVASFHRKASLPELQSVSIPNGRDARKPELQCCLCTVYTLNVTIVYFLSFFLSFFLAFFFLACFFLSCLLSFFLVFILSFVFHDKVHTYACMEMMLNLPVTVHFHIGTI